MSRRERTRLATIAVLAGICVASCTIMLDADKTQCRSDADCARFAAKCNLKVGLCAPPAVIQYPDGGADARSDADGPRDSGGPDLPPTWGYPPMCRVFDNRVRLLNLSADGGLKPLP